MRPLKLAIANINLIATASLFVMTLISFEGSASATPLIAIREAENCAGCHKPGRSQKPVLWRRCTLDCQGCHVDPSGAGPRNQWGYYYANDQMAAINIISPIDPLADTSRFDLHYDGRMIKRSSGGETRSFPMASEASFRLRPFVRWIHFTYQKLFLGRIGEQNFTKTGGERQIKDRYQLMIDALPMNMYVKAGRGIPVYGLRRPNHTTWIRERIDLDEFATTDAVTIGGTPNVPYMHLSQMTGNPNAAEEDKQKGTSFHGGLRGVSFAWNINSSYWNTKSTKASINMKALGLGGKLFNFIFYGERNWRTIKEFSLSRQVKESFGSRAIKLHPSSTISDYSFAFAGIKGIMVGVNYEELQDSLLDSKRTSYFLDLHPIPYLQFEYWKRFESGSRNVEDSLAILHLVGDF